MSVAHSRVISDSLHFHCTVSLPALPVINHHELAKISPSNNHVTQSPFAFLQQVLTSCFSVTFYFLLLHSIHYISYAYKGVSFKLNFSWDVQAVTDMFRGCWSR